MPWRRTKASGQENQLINLYVKIPQNIIFTKGILLNRRKKVIYILKSWGPQKMLLLGAVHIETQAYPINVKNRFKIFLDSPFTHWIA
jgi:hypothetical protein